jgi:hypothetical protein
VTTNRIDNRLNDVQTARFVRGARAPFLLVGKPLIICARPYEATKVADRHPVQALPLGLFVPLVLR